jgi:hypothetical protein
MHFIVFLIALVTSTAYADECHGTYIKNFDICQALRQTAKEFAKSLPMQMDSTMAMTKAYAFGKTMSYEITYFYDISVLQNHLSQVGWSKKQGEEFLLKKAKNSLCQGDGLWLIKNGAIFHYDYIFIDQTPYFSFEVSQC